MRRYESACCEGLIALCPYTYEGCARTCTYFSEQCKCSLQSLLAAHHLTPHIFFKCYQFAWKCLMELPRSWTRSQRRAWSLLRKLLRNTASAPPRASARTQTSRSSRTKWYARSLSCAFLLYASVAAFFTLIQREVRMESFDEAASFSLLSLACV